MHQSNLPFKSLAECHDTFRGVTRRQGIKTAKAEPIICESGQIPGSAYQFLNPFDGTPLNLYA
jgi:hypothetical protein